MLKEKKFGYQEQNMREKGLEIKKERSLSNPKKKESTFWKTIKKLSPHVHWTRIETFGTPGIPDLLGVLDFKSFWLELKVTTKNRVHVSPFQIAWNQKRYELCGDNFYCIYNISDRSIYLYKGSMGRLLVSDGMLVHEPLFKIKQPYENKFESELKRILTHVN